MGNVRVTLKNKVIDGEIILRELALHMGAAGVAGMLLAFRAGTAYLQKAARAASGLGLAAQNREITSRKMTETASWAALISEAAPLTEKMVQVKSDTALDSAVRMESELYGAGRAGLTLGEGLHASSRVFSHSGSALELTQCVQGALSSVAVVQNNMMISGVVLERLEKIVSGLKLPSMLRVRAGAAEAYLITPAISAAL